MYQLKCKECDWKINYVIPFDLPAEVVTMQVAQQIAEHFDEKHDPFNISVEFTEVKGKEEQ